MPKISGTSIFRITMYYIMRMIDRVGFGRVINSFGTFKPPPRPSPRDGYYKTPPFNIDLSPPPSPRRILT